MGVYQLDPHVVERSHMSSVWYLLHLTGWWSPAQCAHTQSIFVEWSHT